MNQRNEHGKMHGPWEEFYQTGELSSRGYYLNGESHGPWEHFYKNGHLYSRGSYKHGVKIGLWHEPA